MSDLIKRSDAYDSLLIGMVMTGYQSRALDCIAEYSIPAVDAVEVRHARWLRKEDGVYCTWCSGGWKFMTGVPGEVETDYHYCPNCGARMDGRREDGDNGKHL